MIRASLRIAFELKDSVGGRFSTDAPSDDVQGMQNVVEFRQGGRTCSSSKRFVSSSY